MTLSAGTPLDDLLWRQGVLVYQKAQWPTHRKLVSSMVGVDDSLLAEAGDDPF